MFGLDWRSELLRVMQTAALGDRPRIRIELLPHHVLNRFLKLERVIHRPHNFQAHIIGRFVQRHLRQLVEFLHHKLREMIDLLTR